MDERAAQLLLVWEARAQLLRSGLEHPNSKDQPPENIQIKSVQAPNFLAG
jgi:hypothetical protein